MKAYILSVLALYSLATQAATLPPRGAAQFDDMSPETVRTYVTSRSNDITKRTVGGIFICTGEYWSGQCGYKVQPLDACIHLDAPWWHTISSFGPDKGTTCNWYSDYNCNDQIASGIVSPGIDDMDHPAPGCEVRREAGLEKRCHGNTVGSFKCWAT